MISTPHVFRLVGTEAVSKAVVFVVAIVVVTMVGEGDDDGRGEEPDGLEFEVEFWARDSVEEGCGERERERERERGGESSEVEGSERLSFHTFSYHFV